MRLRQFEKRVVVGSRFLTVPAILGSLAGSILMFWLGLFNIYEAFHSSLGWPASASAAIPGKDEAAAKVPAGAAAVISVIEGLDRFLIAIVLLYFSYGVYSLFIHPDESDENLALPAWLRVQQIGQLKQVVAEVIIVVLFVLFLRVALQAYQSSNMSLTGEQIATFALLPACTALLALSLRLAELHPKPPRRKPR